MSNRAKLIDQLSDHMNESAGGSVPTDDRFAGFVPNDAAGGLMPLENIMEDEDQPRKSFDEQKLKELAENIKNHGVQSAIQLRWSEKNKKWLIVYGHRRFRASKLAGLKSIPCSFTDEDVDEPTIRIRQLVENCQREDLAPLEMSRAIESLSKLTKWSNRRIADELGFAPKTINRYLNLLKLPDDLQQSVDNGELAPSVAVEVLKIKDLTQQKKAGREIAQQKLNRQQAKQIIAEAAEPTINSIKQADRPKAKELLFQSKSVTILRDPDVNDARIQKELLRAAAELDPEKKES